MQKVIIMRWGPVVCVALLSITKNGPEIRVTYPIITAALGLPRGLCNRFQVEKNSVSSCKL